MRHMNANFVSHLPKFPRELCRDAFRKITYAVLPGRSRSILYRSTPSGQNALCLARDVTIDPFPLQLSSASGLSLYGSKHEFVEMKDKS